MFNKIKRKKNQNWLLKISTIIIGLSIIGCKKPQEGRFNYQATGFALETIIVQGNTAWIKTPAKTTIYKVKPNGGRIEIKYPDGKTHSSYWVFEQGLLKIDNGQLYRRANPQ